MPENISSSLFQMAAFWIELLLLQADRTETDNLRRGLYEVTVTLHQADSDMIIIWESSHRNKAQGVEPCKHYSYAPTK